MNAPIAKYLFINYYRKNVSLFKRQISCVTTAEITGTYAVDRRTLHRTPKEQSMLGECTLLPSDIDSVRKEIVMLPLLSQTRDSQNNFQNTAGSTVMSPRVIVTPALRDCTFDSRTLKSAPAKIRVATRAGYQSGILFSATFVTW